VCVCVCVCVCSEIEYLLPMANDGIFNNLIVVILSGGQTLKNPPKSLVLEWTV